MDADIQTKELKFLFPEKEIEIAGCKFTLKPFTFHETFVVAGLLKDVLGLMQAGMGVDQIAKVVVQCADGVEQTMSMALGLDVEDIQKFDNANAMKTIVNIIEINKDFFVDAVQKELGHLNGLLEQPQDAKPSAKKQSRSSTTASR